MKPNILFITIDSLRADRFFEKNRTTKTPNIDSLINKGTYFSQAISAADQTGASLSSVFTGLFPFKSGKNQIKFDTSTKTYFDILKQANYYTYALVPDISFFKESILNLDDKVIYDFENRTNQQRLDVLSEQINEQIKQKKMKEPWIYYIHLMDIHIPFSVPDEYDKNEFGDTKYDKLVSYVDIWLGNILNCIDLEKTLVILSSDHGEYIPVTDESITETPKIQHILTKGPKTLPFIEKMKMKTLLNVRFAAQTYRKEKLKRSLSPYQMRSLNTRATLDLFDEIVRIPLLFAGFNVEKNKIISALVRNVDIFPTVLDMLGLINPDNIDGRSLLPLMQGDKLDEHPAYIEVGINLAQLINSKNPKAQPKVIGIRTSNYKYYRLRVDPKKHIHLFDLINDPLEEHNIAKSNPEIVSTMEKILYEMIKDSQNNESDTLSDEEIKRAQETLLRLGYI